MTFSEFPQIPDDVSGAWPGPTEAELAEFAVLEAAGELIARLEAARDPGEVLADRAATIVAAEVARAAGLDPLSVLWDDEQVPTGPHRAAAHQP